MPDACGCNKTALLAPAMFSDKDSCSSGKTQLFCGVGGTLHMHAQQKSYGCMNDILHTHALQLTALHSSSVA